jgi:pilus assembly protein CpaC
MTGGRAGWLLACAGVMLVAAMGGPALAQTRLTPAAPSTAPEAVPPPVHGQPITLEVGTGLLVPLPRPAATVLSAEPSIARVQPASPTSLFLMGAAVGHTTVIATSDTGAPIAQYDVTVVGGAAARPIGPIPAMPAELGGGLGDAGVTISPATIIAIESAIHRLIPGGISIHASAAGGRVVLTGAVPNPQAAQQAEAIAHGYAGERTVVLTDFQVLSSIQVNVRVRIAEISRTIERQLGFNWQALGNNGTWRLGLLTGAAASGASLPLPVNTTPGFPPSSFNPLVPLGLASAPNQIGAGYTSSRYDINGIIDALATDQLVTILAEPNLTAQSGEPASFLAGGEFPIPISGSSSNGTTTITVEFKQYGVSLEVVPTVLSAGRINLRVRPEVSQLTTTGSVSVPVAGGVLTIPALVVRRAETTVELGSGQSFAIAGLLQKTSSDSTSALPGAGEIPVIGALFKSNDFQRGESELVIIVTPYLVKPTSTPAGLQLPTDGFKPATDLDRILLGRQIAQPSGAPLDAGFILK